MRRGQVSAYDSSVNIEIKEYRLIRKKLTLYDSLTQQVAIERHQAESSIKSFMVQLSDKDAIIGRQAETIKAKDITIQGLSATTDQATRTARKLLQISPNPWIDTPIKIGIGIAAGMVIYSLIK